MGNKDWVAGVEEEKENEDPVVEIGEASDSRALGINQVRTVEDKRDEVDIELEVEQSVGAAEDSLFALYASAVASALRSSSQAARRGVVSCSRSAVVLLAAVHRGFQAEGRESGGGAAPPLR
nr:hypothetical protein HmN_000947400 [Hymenolepis microstoma]